MTAHEQTVTQATAAAAPTPAAVVSAKSRRSPHVAKPRIQLRQFKSKLRNWSSNEPGAWVIALAPILASACVGGFTWPAVWLIVLWTLCYCVQFTAARWFKAHFKASFRARYVPPMLTYGITLVVLGIPFVALYPGVLRWAPLYIVLVALSMLAAYQRHEHVMWSSIVTVLAASSMALVVSPLTQRATAFELSAMCTLDVSRAAWFTYPQFGWIIFAIYAAAQMSSVLFVKTMIRQFGNHNFYVASVAWSSIMTIAALFYNWYIAGCLLVFALRSIIMPLIFRGKRRPKAIVCGVTEIITSAILFITVILIV